MQYLDWADIQIPLCLVTGFSYAKRARTVNHARNFASARGFEPSEISVRVTLNRGVAMAYGLEFGRYVELLESFDASKDNPLLINLTHVNYEKPSPTKSRKRRGKK